jgi:hypothetical protein
MSALPFAPLHTGLLVLCGALLAGGFVVGRLDPARINRIPRLNKLLSSALLLISALLIWRTAAVGTPLAQTAALICVGMALSLLGDVIMAQLLPLRQYVVLGMAAFGAVQVLYGFGYLRLGHVLGISGNALRLVSLAAAYVVGVALWWSLVRSPRQPLVMNLTSLGYCLLLATMAGLATSIVVEELRLAMLAVGGWLFVVSDLLLGHRLFRGRRFLLMGDLIWMTYITGQALIVYSTSAALRLLRS